LQFVAVDRQVVTLICSEATQRLADDGTSEPGFGRLLMQIVSEQLGGNISAERTGRQLAMTLSFGTVQLWPKFGPMAFPTNWGCGEPRLADTTRTHRSGDVAPKSAGEEHLICHCMRPVDAAVEPASSLCRWTDFHAWLQALPSLDNQDRAHHGRFR
jgi:hypothetical protein